MKHDGYKLLARKDAGRVVLWSRHRNGVHRQVPKIAEAVRSLPVDNALLDGEAVAFRPDGHSDLPALRTKRGAKRASFAAFDLLNVAGEDFRELPLKICRAELAALIEPDSAIM